MREDKVYDDQFHGDKYIVDIRDSSYIYIGYGAQVYVDTSVGFAPGIDHIGRIRNLWDEYLVTPEHLAPISGRWAQFAKITEPKWTPP